MLASECDVRTGTVEVQGTVTLCRRGKTDCKFMRRIGWLCVAAVSFMDGRMAVGSILRLDGRKISTRAALESRNT